MNRRLFLSSIAAAAVAPAAAAWAPGTFRLHCVSGWESQAGLICGCFGVHERIPGFWQVTHIPTGRCATQMSLWNESEAKQIVERYIAAGDWSRIDGPDHPDVKRLMAIWESEYEAMKRQRYYA